MIRIVLFCLIIWTQAQALEGLGTYNPEDQSYEVSYDELSERLSLERKKTGTPSRGLLTSLGRRELAAGYAFASSQMRFAGGRKGVSQNGLDLRFHQQLHSSPWGLEGSFKKFGAIAQGNRAADTESLAVMAKVEESLIQDLQARFGFGASLNRLRLRDEMGRRESLETALRASAGLYGPLSTQFSWGLELNALSPVSGSRLRGGLETSLLVSSSL